QDAEDLGLLHGVDAQVGLHVEARVEEVLGVARLLRDEVDDAGEDFAGGRGGRGRGRSYRGRGDRRRGRRRRGRGGLRGRSRIDGHLGERGGEGARAAREEGREQRVAAHLQAAGERGVARRLEVGGAEAREGGLVVRGEGRLGEEPELRVEDDAGGARLRDGLQRRAVEAAVG